MFALYIRRREAFIFTMGVFMVSSDTMLQTYMSDINEKTSSSSITPPTSKQSTKLYLSHLSFLLNCTIISIFFLPFVIRKSRVCTLLTPLVFASQWLTSKDFMRTLDRIEFYCFRNVVSRKSRCVHDRFFIRLFPLELIAISRLLFL